MSDAGWLDRYRGCEVEVLYLTESNHRDRGLLMDEGDGWLELQKSESGDVFLIPVTAIRLLKVLRRAGPVENTLLRPAGPVESASDRAQEPQEPQAEGQGR